MASGGDVSQDFECTRGVALNISNCDKKYHNRVGRLVAGGRSPANDALEVCAFEVPTGAVGGPDLFSSQLRGERD